MPYLSGVLTGVLLTILTVFVIDHVKAAGETSEPQKIVSWDVAAQRLSSSMRPGERQQHRQGLGTEHAFSPLGMHSYVIGRD
jgi:hypothetical protein